MPTHSSSIVVYKHNFVALLLIVTIIYSHIHFFAVCLLYQESNQLKKCFGERLEGISNQIKYLSIENLEILEKKFSISTVWNII
ncbi:hypothetical protein [Dapis sp. BLCC M126]|uniref:hypothetical protein n=1 Tax=Dapis sp. BLCC M126 TaxID=3400189 RepID=UPI003CF25E46